MNRRLPVLWLRARLVFDPKRWIDRATISAVAALDAVGRGVEALSWQTARAFIRAIEWRRVALVASTPFVLPAEFRGAMVRILAYLSAVAALSLIATEFFKDRHLADMADMPPRPAWLDVEKPWPAFQLSIPGFGEGDTHYAIRRHLAGGGRKDILSFGELGRTQRFINFEIYRAGDEVGDFGRAVDDVRALAAEHGRVSIMQTAMPIPSKFGKFQAFEFAIGPFSGYNCIGFVRHFNAPRVQIGGLSCNMNLLVDRSVISCALDRLTLMSAGSAPEMARLFAQAELKRSFCGQRDHLLYATPKRPGSEVTNSVEAKPRLRGRIAR
ncbi:MAG: hypothetical protein ACO1NY_01950 [Pseudorhodoplanes sp.]